MGVIKERNWRPTFYQTHPSEISSTYTLPHLKKKRGQQQQQICCRVSSGLSFLCAFHNRVELGKMFWTTLFFFCLVTCLTFKEHGANFMPTPPLATRDQQEKRIKKKKLVGLTLHKRRHPFGCLLAALDWRPLVWTIYHFGDVTPFLCCAFRTGKMHAIF